MIISILLLIVLIFYAFSMLIKLIFNRKIKKLNREMERSAQNNTQDNADQQKTPRVNPDIGEYTDFEEIN